MDKLFKDKLEGHALQPSAQAWEKVEAHLGKKNKMVLWLRVAAVLMLLGVLTFVGLNWSGEAKHEIAEKKIEQKAPIIKDEPKMEQTPVVTEEEKPSPGRKLPKQKEQPVKSITSPAEQTSVPQVAANEPAAGQPTPNEPESSPIIETQVASNKQPKRGITLTYSLPPVRKEEVAVVAKEEPKKTGLERVLEIAREVKNGDSPLGELREAKDDILALDFKKDKDKKRH